jgi:hypothetical protein
MWQVLLYRAEELAAERSREADRDRLARAIPHPARRSGIDNLRRSGALIAARIARRLDECVAREALERSLTDDRVGVLS